MHAANVIVHAHGIPSSQLRLLGAHLSCREARGVSAPAIHSRQHPVVKVLATLNQRPMQHCLHGHLRGSQPWVGCLHHARVESPILLGVHDLLLQISLQLGGDKWVQAILGGVGFKLGGACPCLVPAPDQIPRHCLGIPLRVSHVSYGGFLKGFLLLGKLLLQPG